jgi:hypothetical protein
MPARLLRLYLSPFLLALTLVSLIEARAHAAEAAVPVERQVALMVTAAGSDHNMASRAGGKVKVAVVSKAQDGPGRRMVSSFLAALRGRRRIAGLPHEESSVPFTSGAALAELCRTQQIAIVYLTPSLDGEVAAIAQALEGVSVLTVAASAEAVARGAVIGFDLVSGRPQMVINVAQAKKQLVQFDEGVLRLAKVVP